MSELQNLLFFNHWSENLKDKVLSTIVVIAAIIVLQILIKKLLVNHIKDVKNRYFTKKVIQVITTLLVIVALSFIWIHKMESVITYLGLFSAGIAIALKDLFVNIAASIFILIKKPFQVGDRIEIGNQAGDVVDIRIFQFTLMEIGNWVESDQSTGRIIHIPNGFIFTNTLSNYTKGLQYIWNEIPVLITFESDWQKAKQVLIDIAAKHGNLYSKEAEDKVRKSSRNFMILYSNFTPIVYTSVKDSGVCLTIRYLTDPRKRRGTTQEIWEDILIAFSKLDSIDLAYPTYRIYDLPTDHLK